MPPVVLLILGGVGIVVAGRWLIRESRRINAELHPAETSVEPDPIRLERDPRDALAGVTSRGEDAWPETNICAMKSGMFGSCRCGCYAEVPVGRRRERFGSLD